MCMFCAAVPATAAVGASLNAKARRDGKSGKAIVAASTSIVFLLVVASTLYHSQVIVSGS